MSPTSATELQARKTFLKRMYNMSLKDASCGLLIIQLTEHIIYLTFFL